MSTASLRSVIRVDDPGLESATRDRALALTGRKKRLQMRGAKVIPLLAALGIVAFQWFGSLGLDGRFRPVAWMSLVAYVLLLASAAIVWLAMPRIGTHAESATPAIRSMIRSWLSTTAISSRPRARQSFEVTMARLARSSRQPD